MREEAKRALAWVSDNAITCALAFLLFASTASLVVRVHMQLHPFEHAPLLVINVDRTADGAVEAVAPLSKQHGVYAGTGAPEKRYPWEDGRERYLVLPSYISFAGLGFNNVRYNIELGLGLGLVLHRKVLLPRYLHMKSCHDDNMCLQSSCELRRGEYWCPIELFLPAEHLIASGGMFTVDQPGQTRKLVHEAFDAIYDTEFMWFDKLPADVTGALQNGKAVADHDVSFQYFRYMVCDRRAP